MDKKKQVGVSDAVGEMKSQSGSNMNKFGLSKAVVHGVGLLIVIVVVFSLGMVSGRVIDGTNGVSFIGNDSGQAMHKDKDAMSKDEGMKLFWEVWQTMENEYVDKEKYNSEDMLYGAIKGMVNAYDDSATIFLDPEETERFKEESAGNLFEGIGAELGYENGLVRIVAPLEGSPAMQAGVRSGDVILKVDGKDIKPSDNIYDVVENIRGEAGTDVKLTMYRESIQETIDITITRGKIMVPSINVKKPSTVSNDFVQYDDDIAIIDVGRFTDSTYSVWQGNWSDAVSEVLDSGASGLIIDLRDNPGGFLDSAVYAAEEFLDKGVVVAQQENQKGKRSKMVVKRNGRMLNLPVVVLVNGGSASASEILAGALQQNKRAILVGMTTYGKGTAQEIVAFSDKSTLHITVMKWLLPDGTWINKENSVKPDYKVEMSNEDFVDGKDPQMKKALELLREEYRKT